VENTTLLFIAITTFTAYDDMKPEAQGETKTLTNTFFFHIIDRSHRRKSGSHTPEYGHVPLSHTLLPLHFPEEWQRDRPCVPQSLSKTHTPVATALSAL